MYIYIYMCSFSARLGGAFTAELTPRTTLGPGHTEWSNHQQKGEERVWRTTIRPCNGMRLSEISFWVCLVFFLGWKIPPT